MLALLLVLAQAPVAPVTVQLNHDHYTTGDQARVYVQAEQDGYLVVLHADADGRIRVLFPLDPTDDDFIRGGRRFEVRARGDRDAFQIESDDGSGTVLAAVAKDPFNFGNFVLNGHWDFRALGGPSSTVREDPLVKLTDIVQHMAGDSTGQYDYDVATYVVNSNRVASRYGYYDPYAYHGGVGFYNPFCFDPFWGWASCFGYGWGYGFGGYYGGYGYPFGFGVGVVYRSGPGRRFPYTRYRPYPPMIFNTSRPTRYVPMPTRSRPLAPVSVPTLRPQASPRSWSGGNRPTVSHGSGGSSRSFGGSRGGGGGGGHSGGGGGGGRRH
ncbi:MAG TPA: DUF4384 domain-containing protein [Gemmatimonadales bacterium]|nr:DUF4384 domain-containing protein [Gemmatimonadales bacterium]